MPLPSAIEFLAAQRDLGGNSLCSFGMFSAEVIVPAGRTIRWTSRPREYMNYAFRLMIDDSVAPNTFAATISIYGTRPFTATIYPSARNVQLDYFVRIFQNQPLIEEITNLTTLNQRWVSAVQFLDVDSEAHWLELERRLAEHLSPTLQAAAVLDLTRVERLMTELVQLIRERPVAPQPERVIVAAPPPDRRRVLGPLSAGEL